jgi:hypothetical protein
MNVKIQKQGIFFIFLIMIFYACYQPFAKFQYNWDIVGYAASAYYPDFNKTSELRAFTYQSLRENMPSESFQMLISAQENKADIYRKTVYSDDQSFEQQLPFYRIRVLYNSIIHVMNSSGINIVLAVKLIGALSVIAAVIMIYLSMVQWVSSAYLLIIALLFKVYHVFDLPKLATPDALAFTFFTATALAYFKRKFDFLLVLLPFLILVRTDFIIYAALMLSWLVLDRTISRIRILLSAFLCVGLYFGVGVYSGNMGWSKVFIFTFLDLSPYPLSSIRLLTVDDYSAIFLSGVRGAFVSKTFCAFLLFLLFFVVKLTIDMNNCLKKPHFNCFYGGYVLICFLYVLLHFIAFPVVWDRFFSGPYLMGSIAILLYMQPPRIAKTDLTPT